MPTGYRFWLDLKLLQAHLPNAMSYCCSWFSGQAWKTWSVHASCRTGSILTLDLD